MTLDNRSPLLDDDVLDRLRAGHVCVARALEKDSAVSQMHGSPPYSLRACVMLARVAGDRSCDFKAIEGR